MKIPKILFDRVGGVLQFNGSKVTSELLSKFEDIKNLANIISSPDKDDLFRDDLFNKIEHNNILYCFVKQGFLNGYDLKSEWIKNFEYRTIESDSGPGYSSGLNSETDQIEITWEDVEAQYGGIIEDKVKFTSLTKLPRRVFTFSKQNLIDCVRYNRPPQGSGIFLSLNFMNWIDKGIENKTEFDYVSESEKCNAWLMDNIKPVEDALGLRFSKIFGTSAHTDGFIVEPDME